MSNTDNSQRDEMNPQNAQDEAIFRAKTALDSFMAVAVDELCTKQSTSKASALLDEFRKATENLDEGQCCAILDAADQRETERLGDVWNVVKSWYSDLWPSYDTDAILRVAEATEFEASPDSSVIRSEFDTTSLWHWILKRAGEGIFGRDALDADLTRRQRRQAVKSWHDMPEQHRRKWIENGTVDDEFLALIDKRNEWEARPLAQWKWKSFREVVTKRLGLRAGESCNPRAAACSCWMFLSDSRKRGFVEFGIVDQEFLTTMDRLIEWANKAL
jgi:hypothetical protein